MLADGLSPGAALHSSAHGNAESLRYHWEWHIHHMERSGMDMSVFHDGSCLFRSFSNIPDLNSAANRNGCIALCGAQNSRCQTTRWTFEVPR